MWCVRSEKACVFSAKSMTLSMKQGECEGIQQNNKLQVTLSQLGLREKYAFTALSPLISWWKQVGLWLDCSGSSDEGLQQPLSGYVWVLHRRSETLQMCLWKQEQRGTNACQRCHLQLKQTELTDPQLGTNAAEQGEGLSLWAAFLHPLSLVT